MKDRADLTVESLEDVTNSASFLGFHRPAVSSATWPLEMYRGMERTGVRELDRTEWRKEKERTKCASCHECKGLLSRTWSLVHLCEKKKEERSLA